MSTNGGEGTEQQIGVPPFNIAVGLPTEFIPLPRNRRCDIVIASPTWQSMNHPSLSAYQTIIVSEAKDTTTSRNQQVCTSQTGNGATLCDGKIQLGNEYYLLRVDFTTPVPYFSVSYKCF